MRIKDLIPWVDRNPDSQGTQDDTGSHPLSALQQDLNRAFDQFWSRFEHPFGGSRTGAGELALADVVETNDSIEVSIELPGLDEKDLDVSVTADTLTIKGDKKVERQEEKKGFFLSERTYGSIYRSIPLPPGVDLDKAEARFRNGVLTVTLPKSADAQARVKKVTVTAD